MSKTKKFIPSILSGAGISVIIVLASVLILAMLLRFTKIPENVVYPVNQVIKLVAIFMGSFISVKGEKGFLKGMAVGSIGMALSFAVLCLVSGASFTPSALLDVLFASIIGGISGAIKVSAKKNS